MNHRQKTEVTMSDTAMASPVKERVRDRVRKGIMTVNRDRALPTMTTTTTTNTHTITITAFIRHCERSEAIPHAPESQYRACTSPWRVIASDHRERGNLTVVVLKFCEIASVAALPRNDVVSGQSHSQYAETEWNKQESGSGRLTASRSRRGAR